MDATGYATGNGGRHEASIVSTINYPFSNLINKELATHNARSLLSLLKFYLAIAFHSRLCNRKGMPLVYY